MVKIKTKHLTIFLIKDHIRNFDECLKAPELLVCNAIKEDLGLAGNIYYSQSRKNFPSWVSFLNSISEEELILSENTSNKAVLLVKINSRIMAITFGYGRSLLEESCIVKDFGLKTALNIINPNRMRSIDATQIEDMVVSTQKQASYSTTQAEFGLNYTTDIMKGVTGEPDNTLYGKRVSGKDSLTINAAFDNHDINQMLELYLAAYEDDRYKRIGFDWIDNIAEVRDSFKADLLDEQLFDMILSGDYSQLYLAPPELIDWTNITGFCCGGSGKNIHDPDEYTIDPDATSYFEYIRKKEGINIRKKITRDKLYIIDGDGQERPINSIYSSIVSQINYDDEIYLINAGKWYHVENDYYNRVNSFISNSIDRSSLNLPDCPANYNEGEYNKMVAAGNSDFCLMDRVLFAPENGPKQIESCDLFTRNNQFIHVKMRGHSSMLSHLFAQGRVSAECFSDDEKFRYKIANYTADCFNGATFDYREKPKANQFEVIYAIIDDRDRSIDKVLPFFSKVNLMSTAAMLSRMNYKISVSIIKKV